MDIRLLGPKDADAVLAASPLFDGPARADATSRFLVSPGHFLYVAYEGDAPVGFVSGVEMTHPDKGTEMLVYELAVAAEHRRRGFGRALVATLRENARARGCYGMWVLTDTDNAAALTTYGASGADEESEHVMLGWRFRPDGSSPTL